MYIKPGERVIIFCVLFFGLPVLFCLFILFMYLIIVFPGLLLPLIWFFLCAYWALEWK